MAEEHDIIRKVGSERDLVELVRKASAGLQGMDLAGGSNHGHAQAVHASGSPRKG